MQLLSPFCIVQLIKQSYTTIYKCHKCQRACILVKVITVQPSIYTYCPCGCLWYFDSISPFNICLNNEQLLDFLRRLYSVKFLTFFY